MGQFNLDEARAARREARGEPPQVQFGGETFTFPLEISLEHLDAALLSDVDLLHSLLGDDAERFFAHDPTLNDVVELREWLVGEYGLDDLGKPQPSRKSSKNGGQHSKQTSTVSTG